MEIVGKTAVITGASGQLGSEIALCLGRKGMDCLCHYHTNKDRADETVEMIQSLGAKAVAVGADLASADCSRRKEARRTRRTRPGVRFVMIQTL